MKIRRIYILQITNLNKQILNICCACYNEVRTPSPCIPGTSIAYAVRAFLYLFLCFCRVFDILMQLPLYLLRLLGIRTKEELKGHVQNRVTFTSELKLTYFLKIKNGQLRWMKILTVPYRSFILNVPTSVGYFERKFFFCRSTNTNESSNILSVNYNVYLAFHAI